MENEIEYITSPFKVGVIGSTAVLFITNNFKPIVTVHGEYNSLSLTDKVFILENLQNWLNGQTYLIKNQLSNSE